MCAFNYEEAKSRHDAVLTEVHRIRDTINREIIDYNYLKYPESEEAEHHQRQDMRKWLGTVVDEIHALLNGKLY